MRSRHRFSISDRTAARPRMGGRWLRALGHTGWATVLLAGTTPAVGAAQVLNFRGYSAADGLPQVQIMALHQDRRGYVWFGSYGGLTRYDGRVFTTLAIDDGLSSNAVLAIGEEASGALVVGTVGGGVCFFDGAFECLTPQQGLAHHDVRAFVTAPGGDLWVATGAGLSVIRDRRVTRSYTERDGLPPGPVLSVIVDAAGVVRAGTEVGLYRLGDERFVPDTRTTIRPVEAMAVTGEDLLVGGGGRAVRMRGASVEEIDLPGVSPGTQVTDIMVERDGDIWVGTRGGAVRVDAEGARLITSGDGLVQTEVNRVLEDAEGTLWFGTENGASKLVAGPLSLFTESDGLPNPFVRALAEDADGTLWAGTRQGLAYRVGNRFETWSLGVEGGPPRIYAVGPIPGGGLLVGTRDGLFKVDGPTVERYGQDEGLPHPFVTSLHPDPERGVWVGTGAGLVRWVDGEIVPVALPGVDEPFVISLAAGRGGTLYVGLRAGGMVVLDGDDVRVLGAEEGLSDQTIWSLAAAADGGVWAGTNGEGAFHLSPGGIRQVTTADGLINDFVWQVLEASRGEVWFFTSRGLDRLSGDGVTHYGRGQGLSDLEGTAGAALEDRDGNLWFGTGTGVYRYMPSRDVPITTTPPVFVEALESAAGPLPLEGARVPPHSGVLRVRFSSPSFRDEDATEFRWRLLGSDSIWSPPSEESTVMLAGLSPGDYVLEAVAELPGGIRSARPARVGFTVLPTFWQSLWFRGGLVALLGIPVVVGPFVRARRLESERRRLNELVASRTAELRRNNTRLEQEVTERKNAELALRASEAQLRQAQKLEAVGRLAGGIAHDFNNLLTSVIGHAQLAIEELGGEHPVHDDVAEIQRSARRGASLVSQLLAFSRRQIVHCRVIDVGEAVREALRMLRRLIGADIDLDVRIDEGPTFVEIDPTQLDQILMNLAVNARDAMPSGGLLTIRVSRAPGTTGMEELGPDQVPRGDYVLVHVSDEGVGMSESTLQHAFEPFFTTKGDGEGTGLGLATVYGVVRQHQGFVQVRSSRRDGTHFYLYLPMAAAPTDEARDSANAEVGAHAPDPANVGLGSTGGSTSGPTGG